MESCALKMEEAASNQGTQAATKSPKSKETDSPSDPPGGTPVTTLTLAVGLSFYFLTFETLRDKICVVLSPWCVMICYSSNGKLTKVLRNTD